MPFKKLQDISSAIKTVNDGARAVRNVTNTANNKSVTGTVLLTEPSFWFKHTNVLTL